MEVRIAVAGESQRCQAGFLHDDTQFLVQFADQCFLRPLAIMNLAAGKFPEARHRFSGRTLRQQDAAISIDQGASYDKKDFHAYGLRIKGMRLWVNGVPTVLKTSCSFSPPATAIYFLLTTQSGGIMFKTIV